MKALTRKTDSRSDTDIRLEIADTQARAREFRREHRLFAEDVHEAINRQLAEAKARLERTLLNAGAAITQLGLPDLLELHRLWQLGRDEAFEQVRQTKL